MSSFMIAGYRPGLQVADRNSEREEGRGWIPPPEGRGWIPPLLKGSN